MHQVMKASLDVEEESYKNQNVSKLKLLIIGKKQ